MIRLRTILAQNIKAYRKEINISQIKLAEMVDSAPNYIAMIETEKRFPTDTMLEKIAVALKKEPFELFSNVLIQKEWQKTILAELTEFISQKIDETQHKAG